MMLVCACKKPMSCCNSSFGKLWATRLIGKRLQRHGLRSLLLFRHPKKSCLQKQFQSQVLLAFLCIRPIQSWNHNKASTAAAINNWLTTTQRFATLSSRNEDQPSQSPYQQGHARRCAQPQLKLHAKLLMRKLDAGVAWQSRGVKRLHFFGVVQQG
jgi:hypothetical protein